MEETPASDKSKNKKWGWRTWFGFALLLVIAMLAGIIALDKVEMQTSYGLNIVLGSLAVLSGNFSQWAFTNKGK